MNRLHPRVPILDPAQPPYQAEHTRWLLRVLTMPGGGPEHVRVHVWATDTFYGTGTVRLPCVATCDN